MARGGGGGVVQVIAEGASIWETFVIERENGPGPVGVGDRITLRTGTNNQFGEGFYLMAEPNGRHSDQATLDRGWWIDWAKSLPGDGVGGDYDIMDDNFHRGMHAAYDRIQKGWIVPKVLTPEDKAYYMLAPSIDSPESFILWDPKFPEEWYVVENRQRRPGLDEVPSTGLIISWVNEHPSYWMRWKEPTGTGRYPAVISAAAPAAPPNDFASLVLLRNRFYKRRDPNTAFRSGSVLLRRGDGSPSRFRLFFKELTDERVAFCIL
jgi:hypothetical protein